MHYTISGTYQGGKISLNELPPFDKPSQVMVVFLDEPFSIHEQPKAKISKRQQQLGRLSDYKADPAFYEPLDKDELEKW
ncbi:MULTISPECIES: hypothetical protein [Moraxella]|jgi:hypothetical protein|uniref:DUF2281 domain-containing protein n=1 Tax=Moraxella lacunata TaxID=477 RepID=A0A1B8PVH5_MORLA|nr:MULTISPECIES: hypothetical protein [Moraxella]MBE9579746.1 hypothetical protein [Moraxella sp. K1664]MBE9589072.1 hypothetical protein [Moraxella sp. K1630]MBE9597355.1 hypothetical protein [Moraxella sp. K2450]MDI4483923.1 hypothetical protein [Moraxella lacunata]MDI4508350.1 hypothetical protein [Moraxella lacunata]